MRAAALVGSTFISVSLMMNVMWDIYVTLVVSPAFQNGVPPLVIHYGMLRQLVYSLCFAVIRCMAIPRNLCQPRQDLDPPKDSMLLSFCSASLCHELLGHQPLVVGFTCCDQPGDGIPGGRSRLAGGDVPLAIARSATACHCLAVHSIPSPGTNPSPIHDRIQPGPSDSPIAD